MSAAWISIVATRVIVMICNVRLSAPPGDRKERPADITGGTVGGPRTMTGPTFMAQTVAYIRAFQGSSVVWLLHILEWLALIDKHQERQHFWFQKAFGISERGRGGDSVAGWYLKHVSWDLEFLFPSDKLNPIETNELSGIEKVLKFTNQQVCISTHIRMGKKVNIRHFLSKIP